MSRSYREGCQKMECEGVRIQINPLVSELEPSYLCVDVKQLLSSFLSQIKPNIC